MSAADVGCPAVLRLHLNFSGSVNTSLLNSRCAGDALNEEPSAGPGRPTEEDLEKIRVIKPEPPVTEVTLHDGTTRRLWCTFGSQQIDIDCFSAPGVDFPLLPE